MLCAQGMVKALDLKRTQWRFTSKCTKIVTDFACAESHVNKHLSTCQSLKTPVKISLTNEGVLLSVKSPKLKYG